MTEITNYELPNWVPEVGKWFSPAAGDTFDPSGSWRHSFVLVEHSPSLKGRRIRNRGHLVLDRKATDEGFTLDVEILARRWPAGAFRSRITIEAEADVLATPRSWQLNATVLDENDEPMAITLVEQSGRVGDGWVEITGPKTRRHDLQGPMTANWTLWDAVQRLAGGTPPQEAFIMVEDMDLLKPAQTLVFAGEIDIELSGQSLHLRGYRQLGEGILPYHYWLDDAGRCIWAYGGRKGFLFHPDAVGLGEE
jgi:hypothetical protein